MGSVCSVVSVAIHSGRGERRFLCARGGSGLDVVDEPHIVNHDCGEAPPGPIFDVVDFDAPFF